jgi:hypothetical protein
MSPAEMDFIESRKMTRVEICAAVDVPPQLVGIPDAQTYANYEQAEKAFWLNCIVPLVRRIRDALNMNMINVSGPDVRLNYDLSEVPALNEDVNELHKRVGEDFKNNIIILDEARGVLGYEPHPEKGHMFYADFAPKPLPLQDPNADPNADPNLDANSGKTATSNNGKKMLELKWLNLTSDAQRASYWKAIDRQREDFTEAVEKRIRTRFQSEKNDVVSTIRSLTTTDNIMAEVEKVLLKGRSDWTKVVMSVWVAVTKEFGARTFDRLKSDAGLLHIETKESFINVFSNFIRGYITQVVGKKVVSITDTTLDQVRTNVQEAVDAGESIPEIAKRIDDLYLDDIIPKRSTVIARTEVIGASNYGSRMGAKETGLNLQKEWLETQDGRTRATHKHMPEGIGGERKGMDEPYSNGLMYPGDPGGKAGEVIQCRCTEVYHVIE